MHYFHAVYLFVCVYGFIISVVAIEFYPFNQQQTSKEGSKSVFLHSAWQISEGQGFVLPWQQQIASLLPEAAQGPCRLCSTVSGYDVIAVAGETYNPASRLMGNREVSFPTILLLTVYTKKRLRC